MAARKSTRKKAEQPELTAQTDGPDIEEISEDGGPAGYDLPENFDKERYALVEIEQRNFDPETGKRLSVPQLTTYNEIDWNKHLQYGKSLGWSINAIHHLPEGFKQAEIDE